MWKVMEDVEGDQNGMPYENAALIDTEFDCLINDISRNTTQVDKYTSLLLSTEVCRLSYAPVIRDAISLLFSCLAVTADPIEEMEYRICNLSISRPTERYHDSCRATGEPTGPSMYWYVTLVQELLDSVRQLERFNLDKPGPKCELQQLSEYFRKKIRALNSFLNRKNVASSVTSESQHVVSETNLKVVTTLGDSSEIVKSQCEPQNYEFQGLRDFGNKSERNSHVHHRSTSRTNRVEISPYEHAYCVAKSKSMTRTKEFIREIHEAEKHHQRIPDILPINGLMPHVTNSCWLNAILGALYYALGTRLFLLQHQNLYGWSQLTRAILNILIKSCSVRVGETYVNHLLHLIASQFNLVPGDQQDAGEFIMTILQTDLQQPLTLIQASSKYKIKAQCGYCKQEKSLEFYGVTALNLECSDDLLVHIKCFLEQQFPRRECNRCQADFNISTEGNLSIMSYPDLLVIHLIRGRKNFKSTSPIKIKNPLQLEQRQYSLKAVVVHRGDGNKGGSGHFVTYFISPDRSIYLYDDSVDGYEMVPYNSFEQEAEQNAVVLFYTDSN